jgi:5-methylcytosine-specific restriction protein A
MTPATRGSAVAHGDPWTEQELAAAVAAYDEMLAAELEGTRYVKADVRRRYLEGPLKGRSKRSFEERMGNISAVRAEMGLPIIVGYKPKEHVGASRAAQLRSLIDSR